MEIRRTVGWVGGIQMTWNAKLIILDEPKVEAVATSVKGTFLSVMPCNTPRNKLSYLPHGGCNVWHKCFTAGCS
jgi:hypothetical protein